MLRSTGGQRIARVEIGAEEMAEIIGDPGPLAKPGTAPCVKSVQACLGTEMCRYRTQFSERIDIF